MQGDPNALSSDVDAARASSRRLRASGGPIIPEAPPFGLDAIAPAARAPKTVVHHEAREVPASLWETDALGSRFWNELLGECMEQCAAQRPIAAFAVDGQGLCIAQVGDMNPDAAEATGSRLVIALEQAERMESFADKRPGALMIQFEDQWLTSMLLSSGSGGRVIAGVVAHEPLPQATRDIVAHLLSEALLRG